MPCYLWTTIDRLAPAVGSASHSWLFAMEQQEQQQEQQQGNGPEESLPAGAEDAKPSQELVDLVHELARARLERNLKSATEPQRLTFDLILQTHVDRFTAVLDSDQVADAVLSLTHLRLDRLRIGAIENLDVFGDSVTNLYLQHNFISKIENLEALQHRLRFLVLSGNRIAKMEGLAALQALEYLNLAENLIEALPEEERELPKSIRILDMHDNPVSEKQGYVATLLRWLPRLTSLDDMHVDRADRLAVGASVEFVDSDNDEGDDGSENGSDDDDDDEKEEEREETEPLEDADGHPSDAGVAATANRRQEDFYQEILEEWRCSKQQVLSRTREQTMQALQELETQRETLLAGARQVLEAVRQKKWQQQQQQQQ